MHAVPALQRSVHDLIDEYEGKRSALADEIAALDAAHDRITMAASVQGAFYDTIVTKPRLHEGTLQKQLLSSGWKAIYNRLQIDRVASARDKKLFETTIADPPPLTIDNAKATFGDYFTRPRYHILRGLAETFADLDPAYKSHSKVRIGVQGLPKRIILRGGDIRAGAATSSRTSRTHWRPTRASRISNGSKSSTSRSSARPATPVSTGASFGAMPCAAKARSILLPTAAWPFAALPMATRTSSSTSGRCSILIARSASSMARCCPTPRRKG